MMKCTKNTNTKYKRITIRSLFNSLEEVMARSPEITLDSEVIISDLNMGVFKSELRVYPTFDYKDRKTKIGIYLNPNEKDELIEDEDIENLLEEVQPKKVEQPQVQQVKPEVPHYSKEVNTAGIKVEYLTPETKKPTKELAWINKYRR